MSNRHQERLATTDDLGVVHSYGYGCLTELLRQLDSGTIGAIPFTERWKEVVAAVEFRSAEIQAVVLQQELGLTAGPGRTIHVHPPMPLTPIYEDDIPHNGEDDLQ
jgi:hypothetical protein